MLTSTSSYGFQLKHLRSPVSAFQVAFSTVGKQGAYGIFEEGTVRDCMGEGVDTKADSTVLKGERKYKYVGR